MENKIKNLNIEFQEALVLCNHKKALEIRDEYLNPDYAIEKVHS